MRVIIVPWVAALCTGSLSSACKSAPDDPKDSPRVSAQGAERPASPTPNSPEPASPCDRLPAPAVASTLGLSGLQEADSRTEGKITLCTYQGPSAYVSVRFEQSFSVNRFADLKKGFPTARDVPSLGDQAFSAAMQIVKGAGTNNVTVLEGDTLVTVSAPAPLEKTTELARQIVGKL